MSDTNKFIDLLNKLIINALTAAIIIAKPRIPTGVPSMTENAHAVTAEATLPAASDSSFTKMDASCPFYSL
ncbi:hypothetical protein BANRA_05403 [Escherichia coli]|nr:hypothetical protein BANRA_05403 [Escherichia coli]